MNESPLVSVVVLNYNAGKLLENCIDSLKKSSHTNLEIIVVDNTEVCWKIEYILINDILKIVILLW